jgi:hypothetical protein
LQNKTASVGLPKVVLLMAPFAVAMVLLAVRLWKAEESALPASKIQETNLVTV